jgi:hypothetical protein
VDSLLEESKAENEVAETVTLREYAASTSKTFGKTVAKKVALQYVEDAVKYIASRPFVFKP